MYSKALTILASEAVTGKNFYYRLKKKDTNINIF